MLITWWLRCSKCYHKSSLCRLNKKKIFSILQTKSNIYTIYTLLNDLSAFIVHALQILPGLGAQKNGLGRAYQMHCKPFVQLSDHLNEDGLVSGIPLQLLRAYTCFICSLGEADRSHCYVNDLAPGFLSFCPENLHGTPM